MSLSVTALIDLHSNWNVTTQVIFNKAFVIMVVIIMALKSQFFKFLLIYVSLTLHYSQLPDKIMVLFLIVFFLKKI